MEPNECYCLVRSVDVGPVLLELGRLHFVGVNGGSRNPKKSECDVVLRDGFTPAINEFVDNLGLGGRTARAVLRRLSPRQDMAPHIDDWMPDESAWRRFQVPIVTDPRVIMRWPDNGVELHLEAGNIYEVRYDRTHEVVNDSDAHRIHLQIDQVGATV
jgi:hypothetical protein